MFQDSWSYRRHVSIQNTNHDKFQWRISKDVNVSENSIRINWLNQQVNNHQ